MKYDIIVRLEVGWSVGRDEKLFIVDNISFRSNVESVGAPTVLLPLLGDLRPKVLMSSSLSSETSAKR